MPTEQELVNEFASAIARREGYYDKSKKTIPQRLNNQGDLTSWKQPNGEQYPSLNGFASFPACVISGCVNPDHPSEVGFRALKAQIKINVYKRNLTFLEFFAGKRGSYDGYAPARDKNDPASYAQDVVSHINRAFNLSATVGTVVSIIAPRGTV